MNKPVVIVATLLGLVFIAVGIMYATQQSGSLPSFFPGYEAGGAHKHMKHAIAAVVVGVACFVFVWFQSGSKPTSAGK